MYTAEKFLNERLLTAEGFFRYFRSVAAEQVKGCRNQKEYAARLARKWAALNTPYLSRNMRGKKVVRIVGANLGCATYCDYRYILDVCVIEKQCPKIYIGTCGERISPESIVYVE